MWKTLKKLNNRFEKLEKRTGDIWKTLKSSSEKLNLFSEKTGCFEKYFKKNYTTEKIVITKLKHQVR